MSDGIYAALSGAVASERALDVVANNVANVGTTGFRAERLAFREAVSRAGGGAAPTSLRYTELGESRLDLSQGPLLSTGSPLDLAISGDGFFAVETAEGPRFTRDGSFVVGVDGVLRTRGGAMVRAEGDLRGPAAPIRVPPGTLEVSVASDGTLSAGEQPLGRVALVRFERATDLSPQGSSLLAAARLDAAVPATAEVVSGYLEGANVAPISGMNDLIAASRSFESFQRVIQTFRQLDERTARDLVSG